MCHKQRQNGNHRLELGIDGLLELTSLCCGGWCNEHVVSIETLVRFTLDGAESIAMIILVAGKCVHKISNEGISLNKELETWHFIRQVTYVFTLSPSSPPVNDGQGPPRAKQSIHEPVLCSSTMKAVCRIVSLEPCSIQSPYSVFIFNHIRT